MVQSITIETTINSQISNVWQHYNDPIAMNVWNHAGSDWACKDSQVDLSIGGQFRSTMYELDGSGEFTLMCTYTSIAENEHLAYSMDDGRCVTVDFTPLGLDATLVTILFEPEKENTLELQKQGWQSILDNFRDFCQNQN